MNKDLLLSNRFRLKPVRYNTTMPWLAGPIGMVLNATRSKIQVGWTDVPDYQVATLSFEEFALKFFPDFSCYDYLAAIAQLWSMRLLVPIPRNVQERIQELLAETKLRPRKAPIIGHACCSHQTYRTCIVLSKTETEVTYVALTEQGFQVKTRPKDKFHEWYFPALFDSVAGIKLYQAYLPYYKASDVSLAERLDTLTKTLEDKAMAKLKPAKKQADELEMLEDDVDQTEELEAADDDEDLEEVEAAPAKRGKAKSAAATLPSKGQPKAPLPKKGEPKAPLPTKGQPKKAADGAPRPLTINPASSAGMFMQLIMEGKLKDDVIFSKVQKKFNLDDSRRSYVKWYRNHLTKRGMNPPAPIG